MGQPSLGTHRIGQVLLVEDQLPGQLDLDQNFAVVQTVLFVEDRQRVVDRRQALVVDLVDLVAMDCP